MSLRAAEWVGVGSRALPFIHSLKQIVHFFFACLLGIPQWTHWGEREREKVRKGGDETKTRRRRRRVKASPPSLPHPCPSARMRWSCRRRAPDRATPRTQRDPRHIWQSDGIVAFLIISFTSSSMISVITELSPACLLT